MKIVADQHIPFIREYFASFGELVLLPGRMMSAEDVKDADVLIVRSITKVDHALLSGSRVSFVGSVTAGADHLDLSWLAQTGIRVELASGFNAPGVADYVLSVVAALQQRDRLPNQFRAGVIGVGQAGQQTIDRLTVLACDVIASDPPKALQDASFDCRTLTEFDDLDLITLHVPLTHDGQHPTHHLMNDAFLKRLKPGCVLVNASRGAVVDTQALLSSGTHLTWCFDVWEGEPHIHPAVFQQAMIATPHIAGYTVQSKQRGVAMIYQSLCRYLQQPETSTPLSLPTLTLDGKGEAMTWQQCVLQVFNPIAMTETMRHAATDQGLAPHEFDQLRLSFNDRHELAYTSLTHASMSKQDAHYLKKWGVSFSNTAM